MKQLTVIVHLLLQHLRPGQKMSGEFGVVYTADALNQRLTLYSDDAIIKRILKQGLPDRERTSSIRKITYGRKLKKEQNID